MVIAVLGGALDAADRPGTCRVPSPVNKSRRRAGLPFDFPGGAGVVPHRRSLTASLVTTTRCWWRAARYHKMLWFEGWYRKPDAQ
jgi:hypothetical protein